MAEVALLDVSKSFGAVKAVDRVSLSMAHGEFVVLLGPTGAGKTTILRLIAGLERPDRGSVVIQGRVVTKEVPADRDVNFAQKRKHPLTPHPALVLECGRRSFSVGRSATPTTWCANKWIREGTL